MPEYTEDQEELWKEVPRSSKVEIIPVDLDDDDDTNITISSSQTFSLNASDLILEEEPSSLIAARNNHLDEDGEMEKIQSDLSKLKRPKK